MKYLICNTNTSINVHRDKSTNVTIDKGLLACSVVHTGAYNPLMLMKVNDAIPISEVEITILHATIWCL